MAFTGQRSGGQKSTGYDKTKDVQIFTAESEVGKSKFTVTVFSYNNGDPKVQLSRAVQNQETGEYAFVPKLGRFNKDEIKAISGLFKQAYDNMKTGI